jgi:hypothetical protein
MNGDDWHDDENGGASEHHNRGHGERRMPDDGDHEVGYKRPPKASRFKAGRSGNPKGRSKGTRNLATDVAAMRDKRVSIHIDGELREVSAQEAMLLSLIHKGVSGDLRASSQFFRMVKELGLEAPQTAESVPISERDRVIVANFIHRHVAALKSEGES